ncbi:phosphate acetyltransferase [Treponema socranskii subsp. socranskii VPI DR56BR1116 = ATCC 35536]|uniref:Phosphate acetyltransferase n=1 Tax=Treponema socranskii subsp. socranskii VPI DR56BR1116 = ATCC 35536 TaxID=1125725 RepID=U1FNW2_TRESO|nr:phosphate acetyltransferase [Treponema socranskii subsp. socranskii VPI DR56BR1116 = ATCC 35536]ERK05000.1 phosphate acetyltransferase [Treponema socranskii subsp. socranskii VPI DR56BR1116 = ATCC 35536]
MAVVKKSAAKKTAVKKTSAGKAAKKTTVKKAASKTAKKTAEKKAGTKKTVKKVSAKKSAAKKTPVKAKAAVKPAAKKSAAKSGIDFTAEMIKKAKAYQKSLVLPEGDEERTIKAAAKIVAKKIAKKVTLLGSREKIESAAQSLKVSLAGIDIIDPATSPWLDDFGQTYFELRQGKINKKTNLPEVGDAAAGKAYMLSDYLSFGAMMVRKGYADAMVSGARSSTAALLRAGLKVIGTESKTASSCFVMDMHDSSWGHKGLMIFSDCAVVPEPDAEQLSDIAVAAGKSCKALLGCDPCIALLSFSTKGSGGAQPSVLTVQEAVQKAHAKAPSLLLDGELQADAALIPSVTDKKAPGSPVKGKVNTIVFPNLSAGNIGYKLVQRLAHADAYGPILQGFAKPISDLSRGCSVEDIVITAAITLVQAGSAV